MTRSRRSFNDPNMFQQFDYGRAVQTGQNIKFNRMQNQAFADEQTERADMLKNRQKAQEIRSTYDKMPEQIAALEAENMFAEADQLRDAYIATRKNEVDMLEGMRSYIDASNYKDFRQDLLMAGAVTPEMMPVEYSDDWFRKQAEDKKRTLQNFTVQSFENGAIMNQDFVTENGQIRWDLTGNKYSQAELDKSKASAKSTAGSAFQFKPADTNAIGKQVERLFGGFYDPQTGRLSGLDPTEAQRVQSIQEEAERQYVEGQGQITHAVSVARAARKLGINIQDYRDTMATNPLNLNLPN